MFDVATIGEALVLFAAQQRGPLSQVREFSKHTAGAETNVAIGLARMGMRVMWISRLGQDAGGMWISRLGQDAGGTFLREAFEAEGIDCTHAPLIVGQRTGFMFKTRTDDGSDPQIEYHRHGSAASQLTPDAIEASVLLQARHLHVSGVFAALNDATYAVVENAMPLRRKARKAVSFDTKLRPSLWPNTEKMRQAIQELALQADWVLPGLAEGRLLTGYEHASEIAQFYLAAGVRHVVVKCGSAGAYFASAELSSQAAMGWVPAVPVKTVVDTVGAGDAFAAGLISALLTGRNLQQAVERGNWMGAQAVQSRGDSDGLPTLAQWQEAAVA